jgi:glucose/arabinose dehydrogenase
MLRPSFVILAIAIASASGAAARATLPEHFRLPPGFAAEILVKVAGARSMALGDKGTLFVATRRGGGEIYAVRNAFGGKPEVLTIASGLKMPNGVAFHPPTGSLFVAEPQRILRFDAIESRLEKPPEAAVVVADLPFKNMAHSWKYLGFGPDGKLYVPVGAPCNVCNESGFAVILRMNADGSGRETFARGIRNSVGFTWHPLTGEMWFTDNGRDMLGDDIPPCELNVAAKAGLDFGFPYCHGASVRDPEFGSAGTCADAVPPVQELGPHVAPLGLRFYTGPMFPDEYRNQIFIAEHGSWNRTKEAGKTGHRVTLVRLKNGKPVAYEPFMEGFLDGDKALGRPVDVLVAPDGSLLVSDDTAGAVYRVSYRGN